MKTINEVRVRFSETDALGHVNNANYFVYMENARIDFLGEIGASTSIDNWSYVVGHVSCDFISQAFFNDNLKITSEVAHIGTKSFTLHHELIRESDGEMIAKGKAVLIHFNFDEQKSEPIPNETRAQLELYKGDEVILVNRGDGA